MICTSIQNKNLEEIFSILERGDIEMAEIRLDLCPALDDEDIESLFSGTDVPLIATCRIAGSVDMREAERRLKAAIVAGAKYVDLELEAPAPMGKRIRRAARDCGTTLIRSFHDYEGTPDSDTLQEMVTKCRIFGSDVIKVATFARDESDVERVMALYGMTYPDGRVQEEGTLVAFCMGEAGKQSRLDCLGKGSPFTYAALDETEATAPGQWTAAGMNEAVYDGAQGFYAEHLAMPSSKSFAQRAIIAAALAEGTSHLRGYSPCADSEAAIAVARALGAEVQEGEVLVIKGIGPIDKPLDINSLHCGESGLLTRMMIPVMAQAGPGSILFTGEKTLVNRPLKGAADIMASFGVVLRNASRTSKEIYVPLHVDGHLLPGRADISGAGGSQIISGLLMALPMASGPSTVYVSDPKSIPYMFITLDVLQKFGIRIANEMEGDEEFLQTQDWSRCTGLTFKVRGGQRYKAADFSLEGDWSSAANFLVAGAIFGSASVEGLDTQSLQADLTIMDILVEAGASVSQLDNECVDQVSAAATAAGVNPHAGAVNVVKAPLNAFDFDLNNAPDLFPITAVLAAFCPGESRIAGTGRLSNKESDRARAITDMLTQMGVDCRIEGDEMVICGHSLASRLLNGNLLNGGEYTSNHDHRMVMALKVASLGASSPIIIDDEACVAKSFPDFLTLFSEG
ncbi:MAG: 3-phosphoshikimate 1-carboxyvinyltransferase [Bacteroidales bacterium]|nr:3-phosphoshikimate 1-carboxyvinyltransferase [Bacteroidales bacterium]